MKTTKSTIIWTIIIFISLTLLTMKNEAASDGFNTYGFPFTFYDYFEGKCDNCYGEYGFKPLYLFVDIFITMLIGFFIGKFTKWFKY